MSRIEVFKCKPNPKGKDRARHGGPTPAQLGGEFVDVRNTTNERIDLSGVDLYHKAYNSSGTSWDWARVCSLNDVLGPGESLRVHSGRQVPLSMLHPEDVTGAARHTFTGRDAFVWNNDEGDAPTLYYVPTKATLDSAEYDPYPPEGVILRRSGTKFVP